MYSLAVFLVVYLKYNGPTNIGNQVVAALACDPPVSFKSLYLGNKRELARKSERVLRDHLMSRHGMTL